MEPSPRSPSDRKKLVLALVILWAAVFILSFVLFLTIRPTGDSFTRGLNKIGWFLSFQFIAFLMAVATLLSGWGRFPTRAGWRWLCRTPLLGELLVVLLIASLVAYASLRSGANAPAIAPGKPTTATSPPAG